jgi:D-tyrosyl-tRNA(Tyr) deacylase
MVDGVMVSQIESGLLVFVGIEDRDTHEDIGWLSKKIHGLRIFNDVNGVMNCSIGEVGGDILVVSQFTLHASTKKGNRPSYLRASKPEIALPMYESFCVELGTLLGKEIFRGIFGADMKVSLLNDGPVTILIDTHNRE